MTKADGEKNVSSVIDIQSKRGYFNQIINQKLSVRSFLVF